MLYQGLEPVSHVWEISILTSLATLILLFKYKLYTAVKLSLSFCAIQFFCFISAFQRKVIIRSYEDQEAYPEMWQTSASPAPTA